MIMIIDLIKDKNQRVQKRLLNINCREFYMLYACECHNLNLILWYE